ncbi:MAG: hypothetical protein ACYTF1_15870 [Planctomycetota bacterium]|jgi:hypothetical protein
MNLAQELYDELINPAETHTKNNRSEARRKIPEEPLNLEVDGNFYPFTAVACDVGTNSIGIFSKMPIKECSHIRVCRVTDDRQWYEARVVHCTQIDGRYKIGLILVED